MVAKWENIKQIINTESLLIGETTSVIAKLIADHFNTLFTSVAAKLNEKIAQA